MIRTSIAALLAVLLLTSLTIAQDVPTSRPTRGPRGAGGVATSQPSEEDAPVVTTHQIKVGDQTIDYNAITGTIALKDDAGKTRAKMFFVAYEKQADEGSDRADRPITFVFNGGPGAAAIWLHMGCVGPKVVEMGRDGAPPAPPYKLLDNAYTWLDKTDLVLIDPVGTGYSRPEQGVRDFYGVRGDIDGVSDFIRIYLTRYQRWLSPKFLCGESYGTTRAAGLSEQLHDRYGIDLNGIFLLSTVLNFQTLDFGAGNDTPYPLFLPTYTATAHYHKKLPPDLQGDFKKAIAQAEQWAMGDYTTALVEGNSLSDAERDKVAQQLARFTGLPLEYVKRSNLRINPNRFEKELLADQQRIIGRMDGRFSGHNADPLNDTPEYDPTLTGYVGPFSSTFNDYVRRQLKYENENNYEFLSPRVGPWDFGTGGNGFLNVATTLRRAMTKLPTMKIMIGSGYYDLATPFAAADFTVNQMPLDKELRQNVVQKYYEGGHMFYLN
ncbi:MAG: peptidase S10, partial [Anaerolineae bacterium]|nr:peptidase S10 [Phycisphaerae bacterium]